MCITMQAAKDNVHPELLTLHGSTCDVYIVKVVADKAAWGQECRLDEALSTQETLTVVSWGI